jgi:transcriptional regulator with PAS, ATPase and Fis domain
MIPITQPKPRERIPPTEESLRLMMDNGMEEAVAQLLAVWPELKFKIENGKLVDSVVGAELWLKKFITEDEETKQMKLDAKKLSKIDDEVLITGETGTGKEIIARAMIGDRDAPFVRINCAAMPEALIESELFGHTKGAFTGATETKKGMILSASNGVMFLDEVGDLPLPIQSKLLNVLQPIDIDGVPKRFVRPIGAVEEKEISCRFVCATHRDLRKMVEAGFFRQDLYARISTFELHIKPLRERKEDIAPIVRAIGNLLKIDSKAKEFLEKYSDDIVNGKVDLSLNVRSIEQALKRYHVLGRI